MWLDSLRRLVAGNSRSAKAGRSGARRRRVVFTLDRLEDRIVPSGNTYSPTLFTDGVSGPGQIKTLRDAVIAANSDTGTGTDTISLAAGTYRLTLPNTSGHESASATGDLNITNTSHTLVIQGATDPTTGKPTTIIDQQAADRVFDIVNPGTTVIFKNVVIEGGVASDNGGVGTTAAALGGGLLNNGGTVSMSNVAVSALAEGGTGQSAQGGGIYSVNGNLSLTKVTLNKDNAFGGAATAAGAVGNAQGGGIYISGGQATLNDCQVTGCDAFGGSGGPGGAGGNAQGGGIYATQAALVLSNGTTVNDDSLFGGAGGNGTAKAPGGAGGLAQGGGVYLSGGSLSMTGAATAIDANTADGGAGGNGAAGTAGGAGGEADGGGLYALNAQSITVTGDTKALIIDFNHDGVDQPGVSYNTAQGGQGGAGGTGAAGGAGGAAQGGGAFFSGGNAAVAFGDASHTADVNFNAALAGSGGSGTTAGTGGLATGGGLTVLGVGLNLVNTQLQANTAIGGQGGNAEGGGVFAANTTTPVVPVTVLNSTLANNTALTNGAAALGGGLYTSFADAAVLNSTFADNLAHAVTAATSGGTAAARGGGLYATAGQLSLTNDTVAWNYLDVTNSGQTAQGEGVYSDTTNVLSLINTIIAKDQVFVSATGSRTNGGDLFGNAMSSEADFIGVGDPTNSNVTNGDVVSNGTATPAAKWADQVGSAASPLDPLFISDPTAVGPQNQGPGPNVGFYGGLTYTLPLSWNSPAINGGDPTSAAQAIANAESGNNSPSASATDQRGLPRVIDGVIDIGATQTQLILGLAFPTSPPPTPSPGGALVYNVTVTNSEPAAMGPVGLTVSDPIPANTTYSTYTATFAGGASAADWTVTQPSQSNSTFTAVGSLAPGASVTFTITVTVNSGTPGGTNLVNKATITTGGSYGSPSASITNQFSRSASLTTSVAGQSGTDITKEVGYYKSPVLPDRDDGANSFVQAALLVNNSGGPLTGPIELVLNGLPSGVTLTNASGTTSSGSPYITLVPQGGSWKAGWWHFMVVFLKFNAPTQGSVTYTPEIVQGAV